MDETFWVLRAQVGARDALDALFRAVQEPLYRYIRGLVQDQTLAEDILQEVLLSIYRGLSHLREAFRQLKRHRRWEKKHQTWESIPRPTRI